MSEMLSNDQVAALVAAAREGQTPEAPSDEHSPRRRRRVREIDFSRPTKFNQEQQRRIERAHDSFCRAAATQLSAELRTPVELEVINVTQLTWASGLEEIPQPSLHAVLELSPLGTKVLFAAELPVVRRLVTRLIGSADPGRAHSRLTEIDLALARRVFTTLVAGLSTTWGELCDVSLELQGIEQQVQMLPLAAPSEPSLAVTIEVREDGGSSTMTLLVPHRSIEDVVEQLTANSYFGGVRELDADETEAMHASVASAEVELRVEVGSTEMTVDDVLALAPGDVIRLNTRESDGVTIFADSTPLHRGSPGRSGRRRAVQLQERLEDAR